MDGSGTGTNYTVARLLGGTAALRSSIVITVYMASVMVLSNSLLSNFAPELTGSAYTGGEVDSAAVLKPEVLVVAAVTTVVAIYWLIVQAKAFGHANLFGRIRTTTFGLFSFAGYLLITSVVLAPVERRLNQPFIEARPRFPNVQSSFHFPSRTAVGQVSRRLDHRSCGTARAETSASAVRNNVFMAERVGERA